MSNMTLPQRNTLNRLMHWDFWTLDSSIKWLKEFLLAGGTISTIEASNLISDMLSYNMVKAKEHSPDTDYKQIQAELGSYKKLIVHSATTIKNNVEK